LASWINTSFCAILEKIVTKFVKSQDNKYLPFHRKNNEGEDKDGSGPD